MGQGGLLGKFFRRKDTEANLRVGDVPQRSNTPESRIQDAVPPAAFTKSWDQDETLRRLLGPAADAPSVRQVLDLCDTVRSPTPPTSWHEEMTALLADNSAAIDALRTIALRETPFDDATADHHTPFVRAVVWALGQTEPADAVPLLIRITELYGKPGRGRDYRAVARVAVEVLGGIGGEQALPALRQIKAEAKLSTIRRAASYELDQTLRAANLSRADVPEWQAETFDLGRDGLRVIDLDHGYTVTIQLDTDGTVTSFYRSPSGARLAGKPQSVRAVDSVREATDIVANLRTVVYAERFRLKQLMQDQRRLTYDDWMECYLGNPVTGRLCCSLIWESSIDGGMHWQQLIPVWNPHREAWQRLDKDGVSHDISDDALARLVIPWRLTVADKRLWVRRLRDLDLKQPFKQLDPRGGK